jgi:hypothetical protein
MESRDKLDISKAVQNGADEGVVVDRFWRESFLPSVDLESRFGSSVTRLNELDVSPYPSASYIQLLPSVFCGQFPFDYD